MTEEVRQLHLLGATGHARTETFDGRDHLVVPVVALMEGVIHAVNSSIPEFVPGTSLARSPTSWNGRPLMLGHPTKDGRQISANDPRVLEKQSFGFIAQSHLNDNRLGMEAWADVKKLEALGQQQLLERLRAGKPVEVSVGAFVTTNDKKGHHQGKPYHAEWVDINPDHLAFLPDGRGACSLEMGCGSGRHAQAHLVTAEGFQLVDDTPEILRTLCVQLGETYDALEDLVKSDDANLDAIRGLCLAVLGTTSEVLNNVTPHREDCLVCQGTGTKDGNPCETCDGNGDLKTAAGARHSATDREMVQGVHDHAVKLGATCSPDNFKLRDMMTPPILKAACSCDKKDTHMKTRAERVAALIANDHNPLKDQKGLDAASDEALTALEAHCEQAATLKAASDALAAEKAAAEKKALEAETKVDETGKKLKAAEEALKAAESKTLTEEDFMRMAPATIKTLIERTVAADAARKADLVAVLKTAQAEYTEAELNEKSLDELARFARALKADEPKVDYSGRAVPVPRGAESENYEAPNPYEADVKALQQRNSIN